ncbi:hemolysin family protein [Planococcus glaciei]|uniref:HlyC/CorC family transporter n=1 Tax=Planococcus glaciei TaxID=459472 RepID=A0A7H8Q8E7_9BACL|nr:hemolysin family protein [Planococcus glaciei]MBX0314396.1 hemolysin family protein [Planococcus glaciei]QDY45003.1 HlyC/CorC family transporter [Planococcus glaciei]QKX49805.1 HlyC/CorC family transporter [Planococcus glaciei]
MNLALLVLLIALTAFFVGAEFAVVKVRMSRIEQLIEEGNKKAVLVKKVVSDLDYYLSACQLGITVTALGLGWLGEPTVERLLHPLFELLGIPDSVSLIISFVLAFSLVTFLHVVVGEMAPKSLALQFAERMTLLLAPPLYWFGKIMAPFIFLLNGSARVFLRVFGVQPIKDEQAHSEEELKIIMAQSFQSGEINQTELSYMQNIFAFDERSAKDVMVPRTQIIAFPQDLSSEELLTELREHRYTRYPIANDGDKDDLIGFINAKEILTHYAVNGEVNMAEFIHELPYFHETTPLQTALMKMQKDRTHIALVIDEYGGTSGIITMEDILEEIVGEIRDEFDDEEEAEIIKESENRYLIAGRVLLKDLEERFNMEFEDSDDIDTIAGWIQHQLIEAETGDIVEKEGYRWSIIDMENHHILKVAVDIFKD